MEDSETSKGADGSSQAGPAAGGPGAGGMGSDARRDAAAIVTPMARPSFKRRHWGKLTLLTLIVLPAVVFGVWTASALGWSYSDGQRAGVLQKISRKGWVCKTWEGTMYMSVGNGFRADSFQFTVRNDSLAHALEAMSGKPISLHYEQHVNVPTSCFGDTEYFVTEAHIAN